MVRRSTKLLVWDQQPNISLAFIGHRRVLFVMNFKDFRRTYNPEALEKSEAESLIAGLNGLAAGAGANWGANRSVDGGIAGVGELLKSFRTNCSRHGPVLQSRELPVRVLTVEKGLFVFALTNYSCDCDRDGPCPSRPFSPRLTRASRTW